MRKALKVLGVVSAVAAGILALLMIFVPPSYDIYDY